MAFFVIILHTLGKSLYGYVKNSNISKCLLTMLPIFSFYSNIQNTVATHAPFKLHIGYCHDIIASIAGKCWFTAYSTTTRTVDR